MTPRILVVEDELLLLSMFRDTLATLPATILEAQTGEEALRLARAEQPDLILLDVVLPDLDGFDVAEALKEDPDTREIPLVFLSGLWTAQHRVRGLELGAEDFLTKPMDPTELKARVRVILRRSRPLAAEAPAAPATTGAAGQLQAMSLPTLVRSLELERRSARLLLTRDDDAGEIVFVDGHITRAFQGPRRGKAAVYQLLTWTEGSFHMVSLDEGTSPEEGEVTGPNQRLLREGARRLDEIPGLLASLPGREALLEIPEPLRVSVQQQMPAEGATLVALLDGTRDRDQIITHSPFDAWSTLMVFHRLLRMGALGWATAPAPSRPVTAPGGEASAPRRSSPRLLVEAPIQYQSLQAFRESDQFTLSTRGVFIPTVTPFEVGEKVLLRFQLPGTAAWITAVGQVAFRNADAQKSKSGEVGMGLQLVEVQVEYLEAIDQRLTHSIAAAIREVVESP